MVMENQNMEKAILKALVQAKKNDRRRGYSLTELKGKIGHCRGSISKHVAILEAKGKVIVECYGNMRIVYLNDSPVETKGRGA